MLAVTIGIGDGWDRAANTAAMLVRKFTGLPTAVISRDEIGAPHPSFLKLHIPAMFPDHAEFLYFDSDIIMRQHWSPEYIFADSGRPFIAVPDVRSDAVFQECNRFGLPFPDWYLNAGLLIFGREHAPILRSAYDAGQVGSWLEQTGLNIALLKSRAEILRLPRTFNTLLWPGIDDYTSQELQRRPEKVLHAASLGGDVSRLLAIQSAFLGDVSAIA